MNKTLRKITISAVLIALSTVLSVIKVVQMPLGGSVTLLSMLPICMIGVMYGTKFAVLPCLLYGCLQTFLGGVFGWGLTVNILIACILLDYVAAYGCMCLSGIMKNKGTKGICAGVALALFGRFLCHFISGCVLFREFEVFGNPYIYSLCYNGLYMLPELILTCIGAVLLFRSSAVKRLFSA